MCPWLLLSGCTGIIDDGSEYTGLRGVEHGSPWNTDASERRLQAEFGGDTTGESAPSGTTTGAPNASLNDWSSGAAMPPLGSSSGSNMSELVLVGGFSTTLSLADSPALLDASAASVICRLLVDSGGSDPVSSASGPKSPPPVALPMSCRNSESSNSAVDASARPIASSGNCPNCGGGCFMLEAAAVRRRPPGRFLSPTPVSSCANDCSGCMPSATATEAEAARMSGTSSESTNAPSSMPRGAGSARKFARYCTRVQRVALSRRLIWRLKGHVLFGFENALKPSVVPSFLAPRSCFSLGGGGGLA